MLLYLLSASKMPQRHLLSPRGKVRRSSRSLCCLGGNVGCGGVCCPPGCCQRCRVFDPRSPGPYYEYVCRAPDNPEYADCCVNLRERSAHSAVRVPTPPGHDRGFSCSFATKLVASKRP